MQLPLDEIEDAIHTGILRNCSSQLDDSFFNPSTLTEAERTLPFLTPQRADQVASALIALHQPGQRFTQAILNHRLLQTSLVTHFIRNKIKSNFSSSSCTCNVTLLLASADVDWHLAASVKPNSDTQHQQQRQQQEKYHDEQAEGEVEGREMTKGRGKINGKRKRKNEQEEEEEEEEEGEGEADSVWTLLSAAAKAVLSRQVTLDDWGHSLSDLLLLPALTPVNQVRCMLLLLAVAPVQAHTVADLNVIASSGRHIWLADLSPSSRHGGHMYHQVISFLAKDGRCDDLLVLLVRRITRFGCTGASEGDKEEKKLNKKKKKRIENESHCLHQAERLTSVALDCNSLALTAALVTQVNRYCISSPSASPGQVDLVNRLVSSLLACLQSCPTPDRSSCLLGLSDVDDERVKQAREEHAETLIHLTEHTQHIHSQEEKKKKKKAKEKEKEKAKEKEKQKEGHESLSPCDIRFLASVCRESSRLTHYLSQRIQEACVRDEGPSVSDVLTQALPSDFKLHAKLPINVTSLAAYAHRLPEVTCDFVNRLLAAASRPELLYYVTQVAITLAKMGKNNKYTIDTTGSTSHSMTTTPTTATTTNSVNLLPQLLDILAIGVKSDDENVLSLAPGILLSLLETHKVQVITTALSQWTGILANLVARITDLSTLDKLIAVACDMRDFVPFAPHVLLQYLLRWPAGSTSTYRLIRVSSSNKTSNEPSLSSLHSVHVRMSDAERKLLLRLHCNFESSLKFNGIV